MNYDMNMVISNTGYSFGKLFYYVDNGGTQQSELEKKQIKISDLSFDSKTGNLHVFPKDINLAKQISYEIINKLDKIRKVLLQSETVKKYNLRVRINRPRMFDSAIKNIYSYLSLKSEKYGIDFQIVGFRFVKSQNEIKGYLCSLQFIVMYNNKSYILYPENWNKGACKGRESYYYNPKCTFYKGEEEICTEFIEIVNSEIKKCMNGEL